MLFDLGGTAKRHNFAHVRGHRWPVHRSLALGVSQVHRLQGEFDISEGTSAKWIFDVDIEKLRAEIFLHVEKNKSCLVSKEIF